MNKKNILGKLQDKRIFVVLILMLSVSTMGNIEFSPVKYIGVNSYSNTLNMQMWINTTEPIRMTIVENLYSYDSYDKPKFYSSVRVVDNKTLYGMNNIYYPRPFDRYMTAYSYIETIVIMNGSKVIKWDTRLK